MDNFGRSIAITLFLLLALLLTACGGLPLVLPETAGEATGTPATITTTPEAITSAFTSPLPTPTVAKAVKQTTPTPSPPQPTPTYTPYHPPTRVPIETAIHSAAETDIRVEQDWLTYTDPISKLSFQYPPDWEMFESKPGIFVRFLHDERGHFIHFTIRENPDNLSPLDYLIDEVLQSRIKFTRSTLLPEIKQFSGDGFNGAVYQEKDSNVATRIIINYEGLTVRLSLRIRGTVGGFPMPSNDYSGTEQRIFKLINTLQISISQ